MGKGAGHGGAARCRYPTAVLGVAQRAVLGLPPDCHKPVVVLPWAGAAKSSGPLFTDLSVAELSEVRSTIVEYLSAVVNESGPP